jgi:tRNA(Ile)-lysidine synthase
VWRKIALPVVVAGLPGWMAVRGAVAAKWETMAGSHHDRSDDDLVETLASVLPKHGFWEWPVLVGVSGGADSVALLLALRSLAGRRAAAGRLVVAHAHHGLRPEADGDLAFVSELAAALGLEVVSEKLAVRASSAGGGEGLEARARRLRYDWLGRMAHARGARHVVVAHTADDQAETILHRALRGTGVAGLAGMKAGRRLVDGVALLRPLLGVRRAELRRFLVARGQEWREDGSNADRRFSRAFLRHEVFPRLEQGAWPAATEALVRLGRHVAHVAAALESAAENLLDRHATRLAEGGVGLDAGVLAGLDAHLLAAMFVALWRREGWPQRDMTAAHYDRLVDLLAAAARMDQAKASLPGGVRATSVTRTLEIRRRPDESAEGFQAPSA